MNQSAEDQQYINQQRTSSTSVSRGPAVHQSAEDQCYVMPEEIFTENFVNCFYKSDIFTDIFINISVNFSKFRELSVNI